MRVKILKECVDQQTGERLKPGAVHVFKSSFDLGHHLAFGNCERYEPAIERMIEAPPETRTRSRRKRKNVAEKDSSIDIR